MRKRLLAILAVVLGVSSAGWAQQSRVCASYENYQNQMKDPKVLHRMQHIEQSTEEYMRQMQDLRAHGRLADDGVTVIIPTVVHVIYRTSQENISDAQIQSQIDVLNEDFSASNSDYNNTPSEFATLRSGDTKIRFEMAATDPNGNPTNGVTRKYSNNSSWGTNDAMKSSAQGGVDAWPTDQYFNIWICNIGGGILGYAQFPGGSASTDGVVISPNYFGSADKGTGFYLSAPFNKGRTATHEVGHWLNLRHIWGDGNCSASDFVDDTPSSSGPNYGCPSYPKSSCSSNDMFMNYMDYVDDACMHMFSQGQEDRMRAVFFGSGAPRASFAQPASGGGGGGTPSCTDTELTLNLVLDNYPSETSWSLNTAAGAPVASGSGYGTAGATVTETFCLADGDYEFIINDSYGDGICCSYGSGSYDLSAGSTNYAAGGSFGATETTAFTIGTSGGGGGAPDPAPTGYCASQGNNTADEYINRVRVGSIDNSSGNNGGYADFTGQSTTMTLGSSQTITINPTWTGRTYREAYSVWIDFNRDGDFNDSGELVYSRSRTTSSQVSGSFSVPSNASLGYTRMRVSMKYNANPSSCEAFSYGEVEDYTVLLSAGAKIEAPSQFELTAYPNPAVEQINLQWNQGKAGDTQIQLYNLQGAQVLSFMVKANEGPQTFQMGLENLPQGVYMISLSSEDLQETLKIVIN